MVDLDFRELEQAMRSGTGFGGKGGWPALDAGNDGSAAPRCSKRCLSWGAVAQRSPVELHISVADVDVEVVLLMAAQQRVSRRHALLHGDALFTPRSGLKETCISERSLVEVD